VRSPARTWPTCCPSSQTQTKTMHCWCMQWLSVMQSSHHPSPRFFCPPQDYFREVTRQDVSNLLSFITDPDEDDALLVPQLGRVLREPLPPCARPHPPQPLAGRGDTPGRHAGHEADDGEEVRGSSRGIRGLRCRFVFVVLSFLAVGAAGAAAALRPPTPLSAAGGAWGHARGACWA
jgi:hypothetical protein